jgi:sugar transferase (PEP-CTERM system associated)
LIRVLHAYLPSRTLVLGISEGILIVAAFLLAVRLRMGSDTDLMLLYEHGVLRVGVAATVFIVGMYYLDLYDSIVIHNRAEVATRLLQVLGAGSITLAAVYHVLPQVVLSRNIVLAGLVFLALLVACWRELFFLAVRLLHLNQRALIVGNGPLAAAIAQAAVHRPEIGIDFVGYIAEKTDDHGPNVLAHLGATDTLARVVEERRVQRVVIALADRRGTLPVAELLALKKQGIDVLDGLDFYERVTGRVPLENLRLGWLLFSPGFLVSPGMTFLKRALSFLLALPLLLVTLPLMAVIAVLVRLDSRGPAIFRQQRVGRNGVNFTLYKFRTMQHNADRDGSHAPAQSDDHRFTRVGKWLRRSRLDELPQLVNILRGDMDFVGPRPFVPSQERECVEKIPFYTHRWAVRPGATGWAQVNRGYCVSVEDNREKLSYDLYYIKNMSLGLDLLILMMTLKILVLGRGGQ